MQEIILRSKQRNEMIDVTHQVRKVVEESGIKDGICYLFVPHTTAAITINENADPNVPKDILTALNKNAPADATYFHREGNADAHIKATLVGPSETVFIKEGRLALGTWQSIFFCEFDGPRERKLWVKVIG